MPVPGIDYHREKYALVALAEHLAQDGWKVLLSVVPGSLSTDTLVGIDVPVIDPVKHNADERYKYNFYIDRGGRHDLVAKKGKQILVVEGKGRSGKPISAVEQLIGRSVLSVSRLGPGTRVAILIPNHPDWLRVVHEADHPVLDQIQVFVCSPTGEISTTAWGQASHGQRSGQIADH